MAKASHPDLNPNDKVAALRFQEVTEAYELLNDPVRKADFDLRGFASKPNGHDPNPYNPFNTEHNKKIFDDLWKDVDILKTALEDYFADMQQDFSDSVDQIRKKEDFSKLIDTLKKNKVPLVGIATAAAILRFPPLFMPFMMYVLNFLSSRPHEASAIFNWLWARAVQRLYFIIFSFRWFLLLLLLL
jgi:hypothetical protein